MYNTILCNKGYVVDKKFLEDKLIKDIKKDLKVKPFIPGNRGKFAKGFKIYRENDEKFCLPKFYGLKNIGKPQLEDFNDSENINLNFEGDLRDYQLDVINNVIPKIKNQEGGTISLPPGRGKTVIACKLISELNKKTLVIVHKTFLLNQWKNRIEQFLPGAKVGKIQAQEFDTTDKHIVIGMLQTLSLKDSYPEDIFDDFGCIIFDECHHLSAEKFSQILRKISVKYMIGLSGTPFRNDKLEKVFEYYIGQMLYYEKPSIKQEILVNSYKININHEKFQMVFNKTTKEPQIATMISNIIEIVERNNLLVKLIKESRENKARKILVLSDRLDHLDYMKSKIDDMNVGTTSKYVGGMKQEKLDIAEDADIIFSTYTMSSEALDISSLNAVVLSTSRRNVEQSVGRILRKQQGHLAQPLIIDIVDNLPVFVKQGYARKSYYKKITNINNIKSYIYEDGEVKDVTPEIKQKEVNESKPKSLFADSDSD